MEPVTKQIASAVAYIVFLGHADGGRRPMWVVVVWWLLVFVMLWLLMLYLNGALTRPLFAAILPLPSVLLWVTRPRTTG